MALFAASCYEVRVVLKTIETCINVCIHFQIVTIVYVFLHNFWGTKDSQMNIFRHSISPVSAICVGGAPDPLDALFEMTEWDLPGFANFV